MSKERLEEIETIQNNAYFTYGEVNKAEIDLAEFKWLIQQAEEKIQIQERVETLLGAIDEQKRDEEILRNKYKKLYWENKHLEDHVKELEKERSEWKGKYSVLKRKYKGLQRKMNNRWRYNRAVESESKANKSVLEDFREQNQRYKQALEQVKQSLIKANKGYVNNRDHYVNFNIHESLETIEALQGGNTNE